MHRSPFETSLLLPFARRPPWKILMENHCYKINRTLLKLAGLWPYQDLKWARIYAIFSISIYLSMIFFELAVLITHERTLDMIIEVFSYALPSVLMFFMYNMYYFKSDKLKEIIEYIQCDWKFFKDKAELEILDDYARVSKLFAVLLTSWLCFGLMMGIMSHAIPIVLDIISPLNYTRAQDLHVTIEYFLDKSQYYHLMTLHLITFICIAAITIVAFGSSLLSYGFHACATLKITNYRMRITMDKNILQLPNAEMERAIHRRIVHAIEAHRKAIQFVNLLLYSFERPFLFMIIMGVTSLSVNLFRLLKSLMAFDQIIDMFLPFVFVCGTVTFFFMGNHIGQLITNNNAEIFDTVYILPWYLASINIQRLLIFLLQKGQYDMYLTVAGVFDASYEGFTTLATSSISYFTVMHTIQ